MMRYLLDTNVLSEPVRSTPDAQVVATLRNHSGELATTSIVWHELIYGAERLPEGEKRTYLFTYLTEVVRTTVPILPYDAQAARWHGRERARLARLGRTRPFVDGMIAAVAATRGLTLVTRNVPDFEHFADLDVENWFDA